MEHSEIDESHNSDYHIAAEKEETLQLNNELSLALTVIEETGANLFLTGKAGTGKTTFLRHLTATSRKRMAVLAPTGVAAINAHGVTIHSLFQFPFSPFLPGKGFVGEEKNYFRFSKGKLRLIKSLDLLVIDEVSMVRPDTLDAIDDVLRRVRVNSRPFGGVQLLLIGDLRQLAPVVRDEDRRMLEPFYKSPYFFDSHALNAAGFITIELFDVYRQTDQHFIDILNAVREGTADSSTLATLNSRFRPGFDPKEEEGYIRLTSHNRQANNINESRLSALPGNPTCYKAKTSGNFPPMSFPADEVLMLKPDARVMFIKNDSGAKRRYYNGMLATVISLGNDAVTVRPIDGSPDIKVEPVEWENTSYDIDEETSEVVQHTDGTFRQLPLRTAWAITIHKSQGLTFDYAIIDAEHSFAPGQAYVALSRCRTLEGLVLDTMLPPSAIITDAKVNRFIAESRRSCPDAAHIEMLKSEYNRSCLTELFDFNPIIEDFRYLKRVVFQYVAPEVPEYFELYNNEDELFARQAVDVGRHFCMLYASQPIPAGSISEFVIGKIKSGCEYFEKELARMETLVASTPASLDNKSYQKILNGALDRIFELLFVKQHILRNMSLSDFSASAYMDAKAKAVIHYQSKGNARPKKKKAPKAKAEKKPKGYSKHESLALFNAGKSVEEIAAERKMTTSTILRHLTDLIQEGLLSLDELVSKKSQEIMNVEFARHSDYSFAGLRDSLQPKVGAIEFLAYYNLFVAKKKKG